MRAASARAVSAIEKHGVLLVYPIQNRPEPKSLWHVLYPNIDMVWSWTSDADGRVAEMWHLRERLARTHDVVYTKWFRGRATFFSRDLFRSMLAVLKHKLPPQSGGTNKLPPQSGGTSIGSLTRGLTRESKMLLDLLEDNSPQATRGLRLTAELDGRVHEGAYTRAMKALWQRLLIVGCGEVEEGGFPSLSMAATRLAFEDLWDASDAFAADDEARVARVFAHAPAYARAFRAAEEVVRGA